MDSEYFSIRGFTFQVLARWRILIVCAIVLGMLGSIYQMYMGRDILRGIPQIVEAEADEKPAAAVVYDEDAYQAYQALVQTQEMYLNELNNELAQLQSLEVSSSYVYSQSFHIEVAAEDTSLSSGTEPDESDTALDSLLHSRYLASLDSNEVYDSACELLDIDIPFSFWSKMYETSTFFRGAYGIILEVKVRGGSEEDVLAMKDMVADYIFQESIILQEYQPHSMSIFYEDKHPMEDSVLIAAVRDKSLEVVNLRNQLKSHMTELEKLEAAKKTGESQDVDGVETVIIPRKSVLKDMVLYGIIGFLAGLGVGVLIILLIDAVSGYVLEESDLEKQFGIPVTTLARPLKKKGFGFVDKWIDRWNKGRVPALSQEEAIKHLSTVLTARLGGSSVSFTSTLPREQVSFLFDGLAGQFDKEEISCDFCENPVYQEESYRHLLAAQNIVLLETIRKSRTQEINKILKLPQIKDKVIGIELI